ncbi:hypothetical protein, partial [Pseudomonas syringae]|nr:hypothetical protein [Pseudomonas syringae]
DTSKGHLYQIWRARLIREQVLLGATSVPEFVLYEGAGISEISFAFDQNMRPVLSFVQAGQPKIRWHDPVAGAQVVTDLPASALTPKVLLDDKRPTQESSSDVILAYVRDGGLYFRQQRDRYLVERLLATGITTGILRFGLSDQLRLQFMMEVPP